MKRIRFSKHALGYTASRGFTAAEVEDAIRTCAWGAAELVGDWIAGKISLSDRIGTGKFMRPNRFARSLWMSREK
jgi:hypothetical protein